MISKLSLQQALAGLKRTQPVAGKGDRTAAQPSGAGTSNPPRSGGALAADFEQQVRGGIASIHPDDPRRRQRALRVLIEASLLREFGEQMGADPAFHALVDQVVGAMEDEPALGDTISLALNTLLAPQGAG